MSEKLFYEKLCAGGASATTETSGPFPPHALPDKTQAIPNASRLGPGAYARQPIANVRKVRTTAKIIPLSVSIVCAPVVDSQTIAQPPDSVNQSFAV